VTGTSIAHLFLLVLSVALTVAPAAGQEGTGSGVLPLNLTVPSSLRPVVERMSRASPTFRRQCARIARASGLTVDVRLAAPRSWRPAARALTRFERDAGQGRAIVHVRSDDDPVELIAHELEHILEQLDGVDLGIVASRRASGVTQHRERQAFETIRAERAGLQVRREVDAFERRAGVADGPWR
jgi:hypothetical protein